MWGYTILGFDGGHIYMSEPEYDNKAEANHEAINHMLNDAYAGSCEVWFEEEV